MKGLFLDSGAHSIYNKYSRGKGFTEWGFYETDEFWQYVDDYALFVKEHMDILDAYVTVDVIFNPELSWKVQQYMIDTHKIKPMPVFHVGEDFYWLKKYMDNYDYIGVGGLGQESTKAKWIKNMGDPLFSLICPEPTFMPTHKIHGFAMTSPSLITMYPWYSVDSTSWVQFGKYGMVIIPRKKNGRYAYTEAPYIACISSRPGKKGDTVHFDNFVSMHQAYFYEYFSEHGHIVGKSEFKTIDPKGYKLQSDEQWADRSAGLVEVIIEPGLSNTHTMRDELNLKFYLDLEAATPPWPQPWNKKIKSSRLF